MQDAYGACPQPTLEKDASLLSRLEALPDETHLVAELDALSDDDVVRSLHRRYGPAYLNLFSLFRQQMPVTRLREMAVRVTKAAIWSVSAAERRLDRYPEDPLQLCLSGWQSETIKSLLARGKGLIVCSYRFGLYSLLPLDLAALGFRVFIPLAEIRERTRQALDGLRDRVNAKPSLDPAVRESLLSMSSIHLLDVEARHTSIALVKALRKGGVVMIYADGNNGVDGPWGEEGRTVVDFFGAPIHVKTGVARLAWSLGTPILPILSLRIGSHGVVRMADPIIPPESPEPTGRDAFVLASMQRLYDLLESHAREYPEQWEGVSALHRWQHHAGPAARDVEDRAGESANPVIAALQRGERLHINQSMGITTVPGEEGVWIDTKTMRCFRAPAAARHIFAALAQDGGVDQNWIELQVPRDPILSLLGTLYDRRLITFA